MQADQPLQYLLQLIRKFYKIILVAAILGMLGGLLASQLVQPKWSGSLTVQIGQVASVTAGGVAVRPLENPLTVADRYNTPASRMGVLAAMSLPPPWEQNPNSRLIFDTLRVVTGKSPDLITLQVSGYSREQVSAALDALYERMSADHTLLYGPPMRRMKEELAKAQDNLAAAEKEYDTSLHWLKSGTARTQNNAQDILVSNMASLINAQVLELRRRVTSLQEALEPTRSYPTRAVGEMYMPAATTTPGTAMLILAGLVLGIGAAGLYIFVRESYADTPDQVP